MAGHNKWSKVKHKKAALDQKRSKLFGMLAKQITVASRDTGGDENHPDLKGAIERAKNADMPKDNIERAIKRGTGEGGANFETVTYETYGPAGVGIIMRGITDNNNRTANEIKHLLSSLGYDLAQQGSVAWAFEQKRDDEGNLVWEATSKMELDEGDQKKLNTLIEKLEEHDDIESVYTNASLDN